MMVMVMTMTMTVSLTLLHEVCTVLWWVCFLSTSGKHVFPTQPGVTLSNNT